MPKTLGEKLAELDPERRARIDAEAERLIRRREYMRRYLPAYHEENRARRNEQARERYKVNKDKLIAKQRAYREANKDRLNKKARDARKLSAERRAEARPTTAAERTEQKRAYLERNRNEVNKRRRSLYAAMSDEQKTARKERNLHWRLANKDRIAEYVRAYRKATKLAAYTAAELQQIIENAKCEAIEEFIAQMSKGETK